MINYTIKQIKPLRIDLNEEELKCNKARINYISEKGKLNLNTIF